MKEARWWGRVAGTWPPFSSSAFWTANMIWYKEDLAAQPKGVVPSRAIEK